MLAKLSENMVLHVLDTDDVKQKNKNHETIPRSIFCMRKTTFATLSRLHGFP